MQQFTLTVLMVELYQHLTGGPLPEGFVESVRQHRRDYDLEDDAKVPGWLIDMLGAALEGRETGTVRFERIGSDVSSFMLEMSDLIPGWKHEEQGESIEIEFWPLAVCIHLSRESRNDTGTHCSSYRVTRATAPIETLRKAMRTNWVAAHGQHQLLFLGAASRALRHDSVPCSRCNGELRGYFHMLKPQAGTGEFLGMVWPVRYVRGLATSEADAVLP